MKRQWIEENGGMPDISGKELEFTYNLKDMKIDIDKINEKKRVKEEQSKKEFEDLKNKMA